MKANRRRIAFCLALALLLSLLAACSGSDGSGDGGGETEEKHFVFASNNGVDSLDAGYWYGGWYAMEYGILETLFRLDDELQPQPWLAESGAMIDEYTWEIVVRDGITFSNGTALTGQAVVDALDYNRQNNELVAQPIREGELTAQGQTVTIRTQTSAPTMLYDLADTFCGIMDVHSGTDFNSAPIGTGPFVVDEFRPKDIVRLHRNETYWDGPSALDTVEVRTIMDDDTLAMSVQSGEVDACRGLTYESVQLFEGNDNYVIDRVSTPRIIMAYLNFHNEHLSNAAFRQALALAVDKQSFCDDLLAGAAQPAIGLFPDTLPYGGQNLTAPAPDLDEARALLEQAGYDWDDQGNLVKGGERISLRIISTISQAEIPVLAEGLGTRLGELGIGCEVISAGDNSPTVMVTDDFDIGFYSRLTAPNGDPYAMLDSTYRSGGYANYGHYENAQVDQLLDQLYVEFDQDRRTQLAVEIQQIALEENAVLPICFLDANMAGQSNVTGLITHPTEYYMITNQIDLEQ